VCSDRKSHIGRTSGSSYGNGGKNGSSIVGQLVRGGKKEI